MFMTALIVLEQMVVLFAIMMIGYFCYKKEWMNKSAYGAISKIVVNILNPMLMINGVINKEILADRKSIILNMGLMIFYFAMLTVLSFAVVKVLHVKKTEESLYRLMLIFSNVGFIGIPIITSVHGQESMIYITFYILGYNFYLYTYGLHLAGLSGDKREKGSVKDTFKKMMNPGVISCIIAILIFGFGIKVPTPVETLTSYLGQTVIPLSMVLIGVSMAQQNFRQLFSDMKMYLYLGIRLLVIPITAALIIRQFALPADVVGVFVFMLAMPVGSIVVLLATEQGADETCCTRGSVLSTMFSVVTIPIVALFLR